MQCSNCGKEIPFTGNVCPHCHANKERDQQVYATMMGLFFLIALPGGIVYIFGSGNCTVASVSLTLALLVSAIVGAVGTARNKAAAKQDAEQKKGDSK